MFSTGLSNVSLLLWEEYYQLSFNFLQQQKPSVPSLEWKSIKFRTGGKSGDIKFGLKSKIRRPQAP